MTDFTRLRPHWRPTPFSWYNGGTTSINSRGAASTAPGLGNCVRGATTMPKHTTPQDIPHKACSKCGETKPKTPEYFARDPRSSDGLRSQCKGCDKAYNVANKERVDAYQKAYSLANKERKAAYQAANRERIATRRAAIKEQRTEYMRAWRAAHPEQAVETRRAYYLTHKERHTELARAWHVANPEKVRAIGLRRRARKLNAEGTHTAADIQAQHQRQQGKCYWCGVRVGDDYHVDHIVPLSRGGSNWPDNLVIACQTCNCSKNDRLPHEWPQGGRLL